MKNNPLEIKWYDIVFGTVFSMFLLIANSFEKTGSAILITKDFTTILLFLLSTIILSILMIGLLLVMKYVFLVIKNKLAKIKWNNHKLVLLFSQHPFWLSFGILWIAWLPYLMIRYPAVTEWDAYHQLIQGLGYQSMNYNWPVASTMFFTKFFQLGQWIWGNANDAIFFVVIVQTLIAITCLSYSMVVIHQFQINPLTKLFILTIYAIATIFPRYLTAIVKDALFASFVVLYVSLLIEIVVLEKKKVFHWISLLFAAWLMCTLRNNGIYLVLFSLVGILIGWWKEKNKVYLLLALVLGMTIVDIEDITPF